MKSNGIFAKTAKLFNITVFSPGQKAVLLSLHEASCREESIILLTNLWY